MARPKMNCVEITDDGYIPIPKELKARTEFQSGSKVAFLAFTDHIEIRPYDIEGFCLAYEPLLAEDWLSEEDELAWKDL